MTMSSEAAAARYRALRPWAFLIPMLLPFLSGAGGQIAPRDATLLDRLPPSWQDDRGATLELPALHAERIFVTMAYTACHRICPLTMATLTEIQRDLDARGVSAEFLVVSYDPVNDDSLAWRQYRLRHGLERGNWHFLSGTPADTERFARLLGFEFWRDGEHVMHDFRIVALNRDGAQRGVIDSAHHQWLDLL
jgi:cytochrome oxidase Cu insertion factor (SCO1/SenC/PrrC family)